MAGEPITKALQELIQDENEKRESRKERGKAAFDRAKGDGAFGHAGLEYANTLVAQGMQNHAGAIQATNAAIDEEMESRVAQEREMRRMEHEKELMRLRLEAQRKEAEGDIIRSLLNG